MQKKFRLTSRRAFDYVHKKGKSIANNTLVLVYAPTKYNLRVGFSVSKKIGKANVRNKIKRRLKEGFRLMIPYLDNKYNYLFIARNNAADCDYHQLVNSMQHLLNKANLITDKDGIKLVK